jgi:hypothetical protein
MSVLDDARSQLQGRKPPAKGDPWHFPVLDDFAQGVRVLAFDATLSHTGWILFEVSPRWIIVRYKGCINPVTELTGYRGTWEKARHLRAALDSVILQHGSADAHRVVEAPSVGGGSRTESSLIAGLLVYLDWPRATHDLSATHVSAVLLGDPRVRSAERKVRIREAVIRLCPQAAEHGWNEHIRDALATGLTYLYDLNRKPS